MKHKPERVNRPSPYVAAGYIPFRIIKQKHQAPLAVFVPGVFNNLDDRQPRRFVRDLYRRGYHVVTMPNPWSTEYLSLAPKHTIGDLESEANVFYQIIRQFRNELKKEGLLKNNEVRLVGVSLGAFISAIMSAQDSDHYDPIFNSDITLFAPPFDLSVTLKKFDRLIKENRGEVNRLSLVKLFRRLGAMCIASKMEDINQEHLKMAKGISVMLGFQRTLANAIVAYDKAKNIGIMPKKGFSIYQYKRFERWKKNLDFGKVIKLYSPQVKSIVMGEKGKFSYWAEYAKLSGGKAIKVLTSDDDFLNEPGMWNHLGRDLILLPHGGHFGYRGTSWFAKLLKLSF